MYGALAQLGERLVRNQKVAGSNPVSSTIYTDTSLCDTMYYIRRFCL